MESVRTVNRWARILVGVYLASPFIILLFFVRSWSWPSTSEVVNSLFITVLQSVLSGFVILGFGLLGAMGLLSLTRLRWVIEKISMFPAFVPTLFVLLACLELIRPIPFGVWGIVIGHTVIYTGLISVILARIFENKLACYSESAFIEGVSNKRFLFQVAFPLVKQDILLLFLFLFSASFSSFSIPLILGDRSRPVLEILIYEKVFIEGAFSQALSLSFLQAGLLWLLSYITKSEETLSSLPHYKIRHLKFKFGLLIPLLFSAGIIATNVWGASHGISQIQRLGISFSKLIPPILGTLVLSCAMGLFTLILLSAVALSLPHRGFDRFLQSFAAPSTALVGFAFLFLGGGGYDAPPVFVFVKIILAFGILYLAGLYRLHWSGVLHGLQSQINISRTLGASPGMIWSRVVLPQALPQALFLSGLMAFWIAGDFVISRMMSGESLTLALVVENLLMSYRIEAGSLLMWFDLLLGIICFLPFGILSYVSHKKLV